MEHAKPSLTPALAFQIAEVCGRPLRGLFTHSP
jgi:hypothetical protein